MPLIHFLLKSEIRLGASLCELLWGRQNARSPKEPEEEPEEKHFVLPFIQKHSKYSKRQII